jgi:hypothetical protein
MKPEEILAADEENFAWVHGDIAFIELVYSSTGDCSELRVKQTSGERKNFDLDNEYFDVAKSLLEQVIADKLKVR